MCLWYPKQVMDACSGPGIKSMTKAKRKNKRVFKNGEKILKKKEHFDREHNPTLSDKSDGSRDIKIAGVEFFSESGPSRLSSYVESPVVSDCEENIEHSRRHKSLAKRRENIPEISEFIDPDYWKQESICCGIIFRGPNRELLVDSRFFKPCAARLAACNHIINFIKVEGEITDDTVSKNYSDYSYDSGYDKSSNPETVYNSDVIKKEEDDSISHLNDELDNNIGY